MSPWDRQEQEIHSSPLFACKGDGRAFSFSFSRKIAPPWSAREDGFRCRRIQKSERKGKVNEAHLLKLRQKINLSVCPPRHGIDGLEECWFESLASSSESTGRYCITITAASRMTQYSWILLCFSSLSARGKSLSTPRAHESSEWESMWIRNVNGTPN